MRNAEQLEGITRVVCLPEGIQCAARLDDCGMSGTSEEMKYSLSRIQIRVEGMFGEHACSPTARARSPATLTQHRAVAYLWQLAVQRVRPAGRRSSGPVSRRRYPPSPSSPRCTHDRLLHTRASAGGQHAVERVCDDRSACRCRALFLRSGVDGRTRHHQRSCNNRDALSLGRGTERIGRSCWPSTEQSRYDCAIRDGRWEGCDFQALR